MNHHMDLNKKQQLCKKRKYKLGDKAMSRPCRVKDQKAAANIPPFSAHWRLWISISMCLDVVPCIGSPCVSLHMFLVCVMHVLRCRALHMERKKHAPYVHVVPLPPIYVMVLCGVSLHIFLLCHVCGVMPCARTAPGMSMLCPCPPIML